MGTERVDTVIVGGGQAGLATGYYLNQLGRSYAMLDSHERIGDAWRKRWDSLRLFTPALFSHLPGLKHEGKRWAFLTKDEMADYLEAYAARFGIPVRTDHRVDRVVKEGDGFIVTSGHRTFEADNVVIAAGAYHKPKTPSFAADLDPKILQIHSAAYRAPSQLREGRVLLVGLGNSGAEIAYELTATHETFVAGKAPGQVPVKHGTLPAKLGFRVLRFVGHRVLKTSTPIGRKLIPKLKTKGDPLIRRRVKDLDAVGVKRVARVAGVEDGKPILEDGRVMDVENVIWCTGFGYDFSWVELPVFDEEGEPRHERGVARDVPGLFFVGLAFQYSFSSDALPSRSRDAAYIAKRIAARNEPPQRNRAVPA